MIPHPSLAYPRPTYRSRPVHHISKSSGQNLVLARPRRRGKLSFDAEGGSSRARSGILTLLTTAAIGFNVETVTYKNIKFQVWDLGKLRIMPKALPSPIPPPPSSCPSAPNPSSHSNSALRPPSQADRRVFGHTGAATIQTRMPLCTWWTVRIRRG